MEINGRRLRGRPRTRWIDQVKRDERGEYDTGGLA
jgi:hypothetical protein